MDEQETSSDSQNLSTKPAQTSVPNISKPNPKRPLIIAIGIILALFLLAGGYLLFKQQSVYSKIASIKSFEDCEKAGYPIRTSLPAQCSTPGGKIFYGPGPTNEIMQPTVNAGETAKWKTYTNTKYRYSIKYPSDKFVNCIVSGQENTFHLTNGSDPKKDCFLGEAPAEFYVLDAASFTGYKQSTESDECITVNKQNVNMTNELQATEYTYSRTKAQGYCQQLNGYPNSVTYGVKNGDKTLIIYVYRKNDQIKKQILSTFKFVDQTVGEKVCTQETKTCPDGTSVGRAGPKCEFAACPK